jgi:diguanylate cyclase (GGDEF)-like protein
MAAARRGAFAAGVYFTGYNLYSSRQQISRQEEQRLLTQTRVIARNMEFEFHTTNLALQGILDNLQFLGKPEDLELANNRLNVLAEAMPGIRTIFFTDAEATVLASSRPELVGKNFKHRDYFTGPLKNPDPKRLYISPPFKSVLNNYIFQLTRMITGPDGRFAGIVTAAVDPDYFEVLLKSVLYAPDMLATINSSGGIRFMALPSREGQVGKNIAVKGSMYTRHKQSEREESFFTDVGYATGEHRMVALVTLNPSQTNMNNPPCIIVGRKVSEIMQEWNHQAMFSGLFFLLFCGVFIAGLVTIQKRQVGILLSEQKLEESRLQFVEELKQLNEQLANQARIDFLTGIYNRLMFNELLQAELARSCRYETPVSLIMFDLDHFKQVNDTRGHNAGDRVLKEVARIVSSRIRVHDVFCRWGGGEFLILAPKNDATQAAQLAENLREMIAEHDFGKGLCITASFGVTCHVCGESDKLLIERVDAELYKAKNNGRNRVEVG